MPDNYPPQLHLDYANRWFIAEDSGDFIAQEAQHYGSDGTHACGFVYVDHTAGLTMRVEFFCHVKANDEIELRGGPRAQNAMCLYRYGIFDRFTLKPLSDQQLNVLNLPKEPIGMDAYRRQDLEPLRELELLHPLRAPSFPDDIQFILLPPSKNQSREVVWGRIERQLDPAHFECILLNQPHADLGLRVNDRVVVNVRKIDNGIIAVCVGRLK
jgi:hypothetical protein